MQNVTLLLGSNLLDRYSYLQQARERIAARAGTIIQATNIEQSQAWGYKSDNVYANQIIVIQTTLEPLILLDILLEIETSLGRVRSTTARYADRTIDIDILYYDNITLHHERLTIPHPRINERPFVLSLLSQLN